MTARPLPIARLLGEGIVIVVGILAALAVDGWNTRRVDVQRGGEYLSRIEGDLLTQIEELEALIAGSEAQVQGGRDLMEAVRSGNRSADARSLVAQLLGRDTRFELPVADWTYSEIEGNADLRLIRDPTVRRSIVVYYARARGFHERLQEARADLRAPLFNELAKVAAFGGGERLFEDSESERVMDRLINLPIAADLIGQAITYQSNRGLFWQLWLDDARATRQSISNGVGS